MEKLKVGLQLYGVRDAIAENMDSAFERIKEMGYDYVEFATCTFENKSVAEIKSLLDKHNLRIASAHMNPYSVLEKEEETLEMLKKLDIRYSVIPSLSPDTLVDKWDAFTSDFGKIGKILVENGIQFLFHNHDRELKMKIDGVTVLDKLYETVSLDFLKPQFDTCWVHYAGYEPTEYLKKYSGMVDVVHIKDYTIAQDEKGELCIHFAPVGYGIMDWAKILGACKENGTRYVIVEQDSCYDEDPFECARKSRNYLKETFAI